MIWLLSYSIMALVCVLTIAAVDADFDFTENQPHMGASVVLAALWPLWLAYMAAYRVKRNRLARRPSSERGGE